MGVMASQITSLIIVYSTIYSGAHKKTSKLRVTGLCAENSPVAGEFLAQMASNLVTRKMFPFDDVIIKSQWVNEIHMNVCSYLSVVSYYELLSGRSIPKPTTTQLTDAYISHQPQCVNEMHIKLYSYF